MLNKSLLSILALSMVAFAAGKKPALASKATMKKGGEIYAAKCIACHQATGEGIEGAFPPLTKSDYLMANREKTLHFVLFGAEEPIKVNGKDYNAVMPKLDLTDEDVAAVLTYVRQSFGNELDSITVSDVQKVKAAKK